MSTLQQPSNLAMDFGNEECNFVFNGKRGKFLNRINSTGKTFKSKTHKVTINGAVIYVGEGMLNNNPIKSDRENLEYQIVAAVASMIDKKTVYINLACGMPPEQYKDENLKEQFMVKLNNIKSKGIKYTYGDSDVEKLINIVDISVESEAYAAFSAFTDEVDTSKDIVLIDIGGGTSDVIGFTYDPEEEMWEVYGHYTHKHGTIDFKQKILSDINRDYKTRYDYEIEPDRVDRIFSGKQFQTSEGQIPLERYMSSIDPMVSQFITRCKPRVGELSNVCVLLVGGGSDMFYESVKRLEKKEGRSIITDVITPLMEDRVFANAEGIYEEMISSDE